MNSDFLDWSLFLKSHIASCKSHIAHCFFSFHESTPVKELPLNPLKGT